MVDQACGVKPGHGEEQRTRLRVKMKDDDEGGNQGNASMTWMGSGRVKRKRERDSIRNIDIDNTDSTQEVATVLSATVVFYQQAAVALQTDRKRFCVYERRLQSDPTILKATCERAHKTHGPAISSESPQSNEPNSESINRREERNSCLKRKRRRSRVCAELLVISARFLQTGGISRSLSFRLVF